METIDQLLKYEQERHWLNSPYNKTIYFIPGSSAKCVTVRDDGAQLFYFVTSIDQFVYGMDIDGEFLHPLTDLSSADQLCVMALNKVNTFFSSMSIHAVALDNQSLTLIHEACPEIYLKISYSDYPSVTPKTFEAALIGADNTSPSDPKMWEVHNG